MELEFRPDFHEVIARWGQFWEGASERPLFQAIRPKSGVTPVTRPRPYDCAFGEIDPIIDQALAWAASHDFLGDAIPSFMITFAPDHFAALLGADLKTSPESRSNWPEHCLESLEDCHISFQKEGRWWKRTVEVIERFRERCDGKLLITGTHLQGNLDCLVAMYGAQALLTDMAICPELVHKALRQVDVAIAEVRAAFSEVLDIPRYGSMNRFGMYSEGVIDVPQCDLSCMISCDMFQEFVSPCLNTEITTTSASIYHLDGPDALHHTESLCSMEDLDMIQWMPGEGYYDQDWSELNSKIDKLGKGQIFQLYYKLEPARIVEIWETFTSRKLFFQVSAEALAQTPWF